MELRHMGEGLGLRCGALEYWRGLVALELELEGLDGHLVPRQAQHRGHVVAGERVAACPVDASIAVRLTDQVKHFQMTLDVFTLDRAHQLAGRIARRVGMGRARHSQRRDENGGQQALTQARTS
ncbi:hypothetical protein GCM10020219_009180 [Nonomuraea dietziae]